MENSESETGLVSSLVERQLRELGQDIAQRAESLNRKNHEEMVLVEAHAITEVEVVVPPLNQQGEGGGKN